MNVRKTYEVILLLVFLLAACSPSSPAQVAEEKAIVNPTEEETVEEIVTEEPQLAEWIDLLEWDLGGWPDSPIPTLTPPFNGICYVAFNTEKPPFDNQTVRQAFSFSLDREYLAENTTCNVCEFYNQRPAITLVPEDFYVQKSGADLYDKWVDCNLEYLGDYCDFYQKWLDDQWVRDLLMEGFEPEELTFELLANEETAPIADLVADNWQEHLGVVVELASQDISTFWETLDSSDAPEAFVNCNYMDLASPSDLLIGWVSGYYGTYIRWDAPDEYYQAAFDGFENGNLDGYLYAESLLVGEHAVIAPLFYYTVE